ncbi:protein C43E11.9, putative [Trichomonas vaginalis G3]|uniref:60S ribosome subunit biogenesis protein NIP7 homolog n=1 Tax=Trichomonas vaginalis (strain ATCC PRA-98 / G3) TaxID=412133 RepID=A2DS94_TRIV3|nr:ribosome assembly [Trichomonas vaginalis G3]EAY16673.1 protein C43E11.9, putative [Trichomonas vaginalis G3]KAI5543095.1 ribosome assembly [Trichomonas vaginalis G3]|eukprot:XP_001328896.1 protein C43E11.9 [Trichomonas vaginalis G3]
MRPLTQKEAQIFFEKLSKFIGDNGKALIEREDGTWIFAIHNKRVYYMKEELLNLCKPFSFPLILSAGICMGKFTKTGRFFLQITALPIIAPYAQYKVWLKQSAELGFLYGQHILNEGIETMTEGTPKNVGVVVYNHNNLPIGLGVALQDSVQRRLASPTIMVVARQADLGEYLRSESNIA